MEAGQGAGAPAGAPDGLRHRLRVPRGGGGAHRRLRAGRPGGIPPPPPGRRGPPPGPAAGRSTLLTPHGGEATRLAQGAREALEEADDAAARGTRSPLAEAAAALSPASRATLAEADPAPAALACALVEAYGAVVALKGPVTFIASPDGTVEVMDRGTSALAKAGTGDVLAGIVGALLAQGLSPRDAAALGCALHAEAARAAAAALTDICVAAEDLITYLPDAIRAIES